MVMKNVRCILRVSSRDGNEKRAMYSKSENNTDEMIQDFFDSLLHKYQTGLE